MRPIITSKLILKLGLIPKISIRHIFSGRKQLSHAKLPTDHLIWNSFHSSVSTPAKTLQTWKMMYEHEGFSKLPDMRKHEEMNTLKSILSVAPTAVLPRGTHVHQRRLSAWLRSAVRRFNPHSLLHPPTVTAPHPQLSHTVILAPQMLCYPQVWAASPASLAH